MKKCIMLTVMFVFSLGMKAQLFSERSLTPVSPNTASLGTYGYFDTSLYTGSVNVPIPIYTINLDGKDFPITLSYQSSETKVAQEASWVGLGWTLNVGGAIVRDLRGIDDFTKGGFYSDLNFPWDITSGEMNPITDSNSLQQYLPYVEEIKDTEPDVFYFNCGSISGSMLFGKQETSSNNGVMAKPQFNSADYPLDVIYDIKYKKWIIKDGQGYIYYFGTKEETLNFSE